MAKPRANADMNITKPAVGRQGFNSQAESAAKMGSSLQSGQITDNVIRSENAKRESIVHFGDTAPTRPGGTK